VWKTTPFVAILLLAGLQNIDPRLYDAAATDGAGRWQQLVHITLPLLRPTILVVLIFRSLDAFRVFDLIYVLTGGGPGTATEPVSLLAFDTLLRDLQFGRGAAIALVIFAITAGLAVVYARLLRDDEEARR
jgi:ABC-type sugar transport system permease subunit